jgi:hypothetical protein
LTCISSWYICISNIIWIHLTITEKMNGNCHYHECDGRTTRRTSPYHKSMIRPVFNRRIKSQEIDTHPSSKSHWLYCCSAV